MNDGHIWIDEQITDDTYLSVKQQLANNVGAPNLTVHIASPGGSVYAGYKIFHAIKNTNKPINVVVEGEAMSMGSYLMMLGPSKACNPSRIMIHNPQSGVEGTSADMINGANELIKIEEEMAAEYSKKTGIPIDKIKSMMEKETYMTADEAKSMGFVDEVVSSTYLKAVALGKPMKEENKVKKAINALAELIGLSPNAVALNTDKGVLNVQSEDGELAGKPATINGQPANGMYMLEDGRSITCENGMVKSVSEAAGANQQQQPVQQTPVIQTPTPVQTAEQRLAAMQAELDQIKAAKATADAEKAKAEAEAQAAKAKEVQTAQALAKIKDELEKETVGDDNPPNKGMKSDITPYAKSERDDWTERTVVFLAEKFPETLSQIYPKAKIEKFKDSFLSKNGPRALSILETNFNYTYPGLLTTQIYYKPTQKAPALADIFTIDQEIKSHKQYNLVTQLNKVVKPYTGCDRTFNGNRQLITNTTVRTKEFNVSESWCKDDFTGYLTGAYNILAQEWLKTGIDSFDPSGTPINRVIDKLLSEAIARDIFRRVSFAAGNSSDDDYNQIDGLWDRLIDSSGASNYCVRRAGANGTDGNGFGTGALAAGAALTALESAYFNSNILLKDMIDQGQATFWVTRSVWDNYYNSLIGNGTVTEQAFENLQKGLTTLTYKGINVRPVGLWDTFLAESDNPLFATTRHLILLTIKENHILGVENGADLNKLEGWYERKDRKFYYEADFKLGYNYLHCDLQTIVY